VDGQDFLGVHGFAKEIKSERKSLPAPTTYPTFFELVLSFPFFWQISSILIKTKYSVGANVYSTSEDKTLSSRFHDRISYPGRSQPNASVCIRI
jgi:hypothetical protein